MVLLGRCEPAPTGEVAGITTIFVMPKKLEPVMLGPWQLSQPEVMPEWLYWLPLKVVMVPLAPASGIRVAGMLLMWQLSQLVTPGVGTWAGVRPAKVLGVTPMKVPVVTVAPWQLTQPVVIPLWLNAELVNLAPLATGSCKLELAPTWQLSQPSVPIAMCLAGIPTIEKLAAGMAKLAAAVPWHCAQLVVVEGALACVKATVGITEKSGLVWHEVQVAVADVGM